MALVSRPTVIQFVRISFSSLFFLHDLRMSFK